ncbi:MAG: hypothetical protein HZY76_16290 [Anaerolineae bacterium]|nr:MAG: hypothetical protein HZY76_16290 [Anaerolineae bacterium]
MSQTTLDSLLAAIHANDDEAAEQVVTQYTAESAPVLDDILSLLDADDADRRWWAVRTAAAVAPLTEGSMARLEGPLRQRLYDADPRCAVRPRWQSVTWLTGLVDEPASALSDESGWVRSSAADALALLGEPAVPALLRAGRHSAGRTHRAAYALSKIHTMEVANAFYHCLQDENRLVQTYAYDTLEQMGLLQTILVM